MRIGLKSQVGAFLMKYREIEEKLHSALLRSGFRSAIVSAAHVPELRETITKNRSLGLIDDGVYRQYEDYFSNMLTQDVPWARSIIAVSIPRPMLEAIFTVAGQRRSVVIPPTYEHGVDETVTAAIESELAPHGYQISRGTLPQKLLATRCGLARYGRNNITYVEGVGSFHRLLAFYTDLPTLDDKWQDPQVLDECSGCTACIMKCPTGAIDPDQFQLRAERCLTYHNESSEPFPPWIQESWHHCLVGCMKCQHYCPVNKDIRSWSERFAEFTDEESALLLSGATKDELPSGLIFKFNGTGLLEDPGGLARNLSSVLKPAG